MTMKELKAQLDELTDAVRQLAAHAEVLAVALRTPEAVPAADLDEAVAGIHELYGRLAERKSAPDLGPRPPARAGGPGLFASYPDLRKNLRVVIASAH
jgi:hypothetical protein